MARLADRTARITGSATQAITALVDRLRRSGVEVIDLGAGEPDFPTIDAAKAAAHEAIDTNFTRYTPNTGAVELKRAIRDRYQADYGVEYAETEIIVTAGGKQALYNTALSLFGPGDEVITHGPYWPTIPEQVKLADALPVIVETSAVDGFVIRAQAMLERVTARTRGIVLNSPCNPTGAVVSEAEFDILADACGRQGIWLVVDLCYEKLIYDRTPPNLPAVVARRCRDVSVICGSASKTYAMTGWRCGWALGPAPLIAASSALQSHATSNASSIAQKAVAAALSGSQEPVGRMREEYRRRRDCLCEWLGASDRIKCSKPPGAFYLFVDVRDVLNGGGLTSSAAFAEALLEQSRVALTPGEAFGAPGFVRISYATSLESLREASRRIIQFVSGVNRIG